MTLPNRLEELIYARVAVLSRRTGKRYAVLQRGAWGERASFPFTRANSVEFTGRLVAGDKPRFDDGEVVRIGFWHPLFTGYAGTYGVVEVVPNVAKPSYGEPAPYVARGRGVLTMPALGICMDELIDPCGQAPCTNWVVGLGGAGAGLGTDTSFAFYDRETMTHPIGRNEVPARLKLRGYTGTRPRPAYTNDFHMAVLFNWSPGASAFDATFQRCGTPVFVDSGAGAVDCCAIIAMWKEQYGARWWEQIIGEGKPIPVPDPAVPCNWIYFFPWAELYG